MFPKKKYALATVRIAYKLSRLNKTEGSVWRCLCIPWFLRWVPITYDVFKVLFNRKGYDNDPYMGIICHLLV